MGFLWILLALVLAVLALDQLVGRMYSPERTPHPITPEAEGISFQEVRIPAAEGGRLYGWWMPATPDAPTLILVHGWSRNLARMMAYIRVLHPEGYNLLAFDARSHGSSSPVKHPTVATFAEDILAVVDFLDRSGRAAGGLGVIGLSVGGGAAIDAAGWDPRIASVVTVGAISHPVAVMRHEFQKRRAPGFVAAALLGYMRLRFGLDFDRIAPVNNIANAEADILLIHGEQDKTIPLEQGRALAAAGRAGKVELWIVPGKGHSDCHTHPQFWEKVRSFLARTLPLG
ncbi:MAG: alpha/beta fold hydrolase [Caldilineae bacterium]|nr:MAG: alpha/beta fold hydrolase [Caldilineae bacterium]